MEYLPKAIMAYSPESGARTANSFYKPNRYDTQYQDDMNNRKTLRPMTTQNQARRSKDQSGLRKCTQRIMTASNMPNMQYDEAARRNLISQLEQSQMIKHKSQFINSGQTNVSMSHIIRQNLEEERKREYDLILQEQMYTQKLANIRRIMKTNNPRKEQDPSYEQLQQEIIQYQSHYSPPQQNNYKIPSSSVNTSQYGQQYQRLEKLKKMQKQSMRQSETDLYNNENITQQTKEDYNIVNLQQGVDTVTPNVREFSQDFDMDVADFKPQSLTQQQTLEQFRNLNNLSNSKEKRAARNLRQKNSLIRKQKKGRKKSSEGRSSKAVSPNHLNYEQLRVSPPIIESDIQTQQMSRKQTESQIIYKSKSRSPKVRKDNKQRSYTAHHRAGQGQFNQNVKSSSDQQNLFNIQNIQAVRRNYSQNEIGSRSKAKSSSQGRVNSGHSKASKSISKQSKSRSAKSKNRSKYSHKSSKTRGKKSKKVSSDHRTNSNIQSFNKHPEDTQKNIIKQNTLTELELKQSQESIKSYNQSSKIKQIPKNNKTAQQKLESLNQNSQVSYLANNEASKSESCESINIQVKNKTLAKKRGKLSSAIVRRKIDSNLIQKQSTFGVSFPTNNNTNNEQIIQSIGSMQDQIQEIENNIKIEEYNLKTQKKASQKEMQEQIRKTASNGPGSIKKESIKQATLDSVGSHIVKQVKKHKRKRSRDITSANLNASQQSGSPMGHKNDSKGSSFKKTKSRGSGSFSKQKSLGINSKKNMSEMKSFVLDDQQEVVELPAAIQQVQKRTSIQLFDDPDTIQRGFMTNQTTSEVNWEEEDRNRQNKEDMQKMRSLPIMTYASEENTVEKSQQFTNKLKKAQRPIPKEKFPEIRSVWKDFDEGTLLEYINTAKEYRDKYSEDYPQSFDNPKDCEELISQDLTSTNLSHFELQSEAQEMRQSEIQKINKELKQDILDSIKYRVQKPYENILLAKEGIYDDDTYKKFNEAYKRKNLKNFVFLENFRENSKQWKLAYDPFSGDKVLAIYGKNPPMSFKIRQKIFETQKNILDRYSMPAPVHDRKSVYDEIQRHLNMCRRDYLAEKQYQRYVKDTHDLETINNELENNSDFAIKPYNYGNIPHHPEKDLANPYLDFVGEQTRIEVQSKIQERFEEIKEIMQENDLLENSCFIKSSNQEDFEKRYEYNLTIEKASIHDNKKVDNDEIYRTKFCYKLLSMINERWTPQLEEEGSYSQLIIPQLLPNLHNEIYFQTHFNFDSNFQMVYQSYSTRLSQESIRSKEGSPIFSFTTQPVSSHVHELKDKELSMRKEFYYPSHYDYKSLINFIYLPQLTSIQEMILMGCKEKVTRSINWFVKFYSAQKQYKDQQIVQKHENKQDVVDGAKKLFFFLKNNFDKEDNDVKIVEWEEKRPHPYSVEFFFNRSVFRSQHIESQDSQPAYEILVGQLIGIYEDKPLLYPALNEAVIQRYHNQYQEINKMYLFRKKIIGKKMNKYNLRKLTAKNEYRKAQQKCLKRQSTPRGTDLEAYEISPQSELVKDLWKAKAGQILPYTEEALYPQRAKFVNEELNHRIIAFSSPFVPPVLPYLENLPITHLKCLVDQFEEFFKENLESPPNMVGPFKLPNEQEPLFNQWLENIYCNEEKLEQKGPLSMSQRVQTIHFQHPGFINQTFEDTLEKATTQQNTMFDSSSSGSEDMEAFAAGTDGLTSDQASEVAQGENKMNDYFQRRLRKELKHAIEMRDLATINNYVQGMQGSLSQVVNKPDKRHQGNTLLHLAILESDKNNTKKSELFQIISTLVSSKVGSKIDIKNDMGCTALDYAQRIRNPKDRNLVLDLINS